MLEGHGRYVAVGSNERWWSDMIISSRVASRAHHSEHWGTDGLWTYCTSSDESSCPLWLLLEHVGVVAVMDGEPGRVHSSLLTRSLRLVDEDLGVECLEGCSRELSKRGAC